MPEKLKGLEAIDGETLAKGTDPNTDERVAMVVSEGVVKEATFQIIAAIRALAITLSTTVALVGSGEAIKNMKDIDETFDEVFGDLLGADGEEEGEVES